jgi:hypothetical protein
MCNSGRKNISHNGQEEYDSIGKQAKCIRVQRDKTTELQYLQMVDMHNFRSDEVVSICIQPIFPSVPW